MIHVCYGLYDKTGRYSKFTGTSILSMFENTDAKVTVHILHDNTLSDDNRQKFLTVAKKYNQHIKFHNVEISCAKEIDAFKNTMSEIENSPYSVGTLYRFMIMKIFPAEVEKVIYLDSDIVVNLDISDLWQIEIGNKPLAGISEQANGVPPQILFELCRAGLVADDKYFNAGVLILNLKRLRNEQKNIRAGLKFVASNPQCKFFDQDIFNYCFASQALILPLKFNRMVDYARLAGENIAEKKIYHYTGNAIKLNLRDSFNELWIKYFSKTPWFNPEIMLRIYDLIQELHAQAQEKLLQLSAIMSGRRRIFFTELINLENFRQIFYVNRAEEIVDATKPNALNSLLERMIENRGAEFLILLVNRYSEIAQVLTRAGFSEGIDFIDATDFLSYKHGIPLDTNFLIRAI